MSKLVNTITNYKVAHVALVVAALVVAVLRNHGILSGGDVDTILSGLGALCIGMNVTLTGGDAAAVKQAAAEVVATVDPSTGVPTA